MIRLMLIGFFSTMIIGILSYQVAYSSFLSSATSQNNTFSTSSDFGNQEVPVGTPSATPTPTPTTIPAGQNVGDVVINEIMWGGSFIGTSNDEWIELRNTTSSTIDVSGWTIENLGSGTPGTVTISSGKTVAAGGFFIIANNPEASSIMSITPSDIKSLSISNSPSAEQLILRNGILTIDIAGVSGGSWFAGTNRTPGPASSMERKTPPGDGTLSTNWETSNSQLNLDIGITDFATPGGLN